jgi:putative PIN family toxin of toxin-antitoxin system
MRVVFDSNLWVSALEFRGVPRAAIEFAYTYDEIIFCAQIEAEVIRVLELKFASPPAKTRSRIAELAAGATLVVVSGLLTGICRDPKDDFVLECAVLGEADVIVSGDKDLLSLQTYNSIHILTPRQYLDFTLPAAPQ